MEYGSLLPFWPPLAPWPLNESGGETPPLQQAGGDLKIAATPAVIDRRCGEAR